MSIMTVLKTKLNSQTESRYYTVGSLFAGIGGICQGFINANFEIKWANELDKNACITYKENFKHKLFESDICELEPSQCPPIDVLTAGFPCQPFSIAGNQKGFNDERGNIFFQILKFIDFHKPSCVFLENVKNIVKHDNGKTIKIIKNELESRGYFFKDAILNTSKYGGLPQNRERFYLVAFRTLKQLENFNFPESIELKYGISELLVDCKDKSFYYNNNKIFPILKKEVVKTDTLYQWRRVYVRENKSNLCPTLTANMGTGGHCH